MNLVHSNVFFIFTDVDHTYIHIHMYICVLKILRFDEEKND